VRHAAFAVSSSTRDGAFVTCLWEAESVESVQRYVDAILGESADNLCYEINSFAERPTVAMPPPRRRETWTRDGCGRSAATADDAIHCAHDVDR